MKPDDTVIIRTHGIPKNDLKELKKVLKKVINATCPFVTTPQNIVKICLKRVTLFLFLETLSILK